MQSAWLFLYLGACFSEAFWHDKTLHRYYNINNDKIISRSIVIRLMIIWLCDIPCIIVNFFNLDTSGFVLGVYYRDLDSFVRVERSDLI